MDSEGRPASVSAASGQNPVTSVTYSSGTSTAPLGALIGVIFGSQDSDSYQYDPNTGRMTQYSFNVNGQSAVGTLHWNPNSTLQSLAITDPFNSQDNQTCNYTYDDLGRVGGPDPNKASVNCVNTSQANVWSQSFSYDAFGNITKQVPSGGTGVAWNPGYNSQTINTL